ncbi:DUF2147 domain-containing protein [Lysobacter sp. KIS68-7]|uniref:DUF2147 domain-containing protein n=1 Tax=Lysobacter sp. KIS68-7 TaxID=2904252 RepID=UPI001E5DC663|nr:DUF2147 domain-containing protein [Lysobacter sp. KIS68-7]UHQ18643.1 DUF2147 domain-containing protein [Lysobacter sp. KIS68-7]
MRNKLFASMLALPLLAALSAVSAQTAPDPVLGKWKTIDDETGKAMSITEVYRTKNGSIAAHVVEMLDPAKQNCDECDGADKGKPIAGMMVFWDMKQVDGVWGGGQGFKPSAGEHFKVKSVKAIEGGKKLEITGCKLIFCRSATWVRAD